MKANIKPELKQSGKLSRSEMKKWGPLTPGEWLVVAFIFFAASMLYGDKSSPMHRQDNQVVPPLSELAGELVGQLKGEPVDLESEVVVPG